MTNITDTRPTLREQLAGQASTVAKAIAAFLAPIGAALVARLVRRTGIDLPYDPSAVEAFLTSTATALLVWATANRSRTG